MILNPILRVLSILLQSRIRALLMGGQACILYGAAEFSRDIDLAVEVSPENLEKLKSVLHECETKRIFYPNLSEEALNKGHACHFRCQKEEIYGLRIDIMGTMRGVDPFHRLWKRRSEMNLTGVGKFPVMSLSDLVTAKKTQRDKDWPMIRRLLEADIYNSTNPSREKTAFWFKECRTGEILISLAQKYSAIASSLSKNRPLLKSAIQGNQEEIRRLLWEEEEREKKDDREYWEPLKKELEKWRHEKNHP